MGVMILLLGVSLFVGIIFLVAFIWSVRNGQFDDDFTPAHKILFENPLIETGIQSNHSNKENKKNDSNQNG